MISVSGIKIALGLPVLGLGVSSAARRGRVEERGQRPELLARPVRKRMIVALGALHLHAQENARRAGRDLLALLLVGLKEGRRAGHEAARGRRRSGCMAASDRRGQQLADQPVVRHVDREPQPQPGFELRHQDARLDILRSAGQHQPTPGVGKMLCMRTALEQIVDDAAPLVAARIGQKHLQFGHRGNLADDVEIDAAQKLGVVGRRRGLNLRASPGVGQCLVNVRRQSLCVEKCDRLSRLPPDRLDTQQETARNGGQRRAAANDRAAGPIPLDVHPRCSLEMAREFAEGALKPHCITPPLAFQQFNSRGNFSLHFHRTRILIGPAEQVVSQERLSAPRAWRYQVQALAPDSFPRRSSRSISMGRPAPNVQHRTAPFSRRRIRRSTAMAITVTFVLAACVAARGQGLAVGLTSNTLSTSKGDKPVSSFTLPAQTNDVKDAIDEFQRFVQHEAWEKAFKSLETITSKTSTGFVERGDGVLVPSRLLVRSLLASMPPSGKSAYRVFYDAQATALWDKASGDAELENLSSIVNNHLASSVGAAAADRLGDLYFERGELEQAVMAWRSVLDYCPDSKLSKAQLLVKIGTALARGGRSSELSDLERTLEPRFAGETVEVGGRRVTAGEHIARLSASVKSEKPASVVTLPGDITLPASREPLWQFRFQSKVDPANPTQPFTLMDVYGRQRPNDFPIPTATDGQRLYANVFGVEMAFDLVTGKMLWRTGRLHQLNFQQNRQGALPERYSITVVGDRVWSVTRDPQQMNQNPPLFSLVAREAATGKEIFSSRKAMSTWNILGTPHLVDSQGTSVTSFSASHASGTNEGGATSGTPVLDFSQGFSAATEHLSLNGVSAVVDARLRLTNGGSKQAGSVFATKPVSVAGFKTQFDFQFTKAFADGMIFILQGEGPKSAGRLEQRTQRNCF